MDTRGSSPNKTNSITWWISSNSSPTSKPTKELLTPGGEHHGIGDGEGLVMTKTEDSPLWSPERLQIYPRWRTGHGGGSVSYNAMKLSLWFFSLKIGVYNGGIRVSGATRWAQPTRARPSGCCSPWPPSLVDFGSNNSHIFWNNSPKSFVTFRELLFLHKNNTMVVLLKTALVRVSSIQIMQIRVQNKGKGWGKVDTLETYQVLIT